MALCRAAKSTVTWETLLLSSLRGSASSASSSGSGRLRGGCGGAGPSRVRGMSRSGVPFGPSAGSGAIGAMRSRDRAPVR